MRPIAPVEAAGWQLLEQSCRRLLAAYGYAEIRLPIVEKADLFCKSIGDTTDIVSREMYVFVDRNGEELALRPEGTASCVRAALELSLLQHRQRLWYLGPMFRRERPQQGRSRQFHQIGAEVFGFDGVGIEFELLCMGHRLWRSLGLPGIRLELNCIGTIEVRKNYADALRCYFKDYAGSFNEEQRRTLEQNPIRLLDHKSEDIRELVAGAPALSEYLDDKSQQSYLQLQDMLQTAGIDYVHNERLVRGLDYYNGFVFEWLCQDGLGAQNTICAGGRYDQLVASMGGADIPAAGFAIGLDRVMALLSNAANGQAVAVAPRVSIVSVSTEQTVACLTLAEQLRDQLPDLAISVDCSGSSMKNQLRQADRTGAACALLLGADELERGEVTLKMMQDEAVPQQAVAINALADKLHTIFPKILG